MMACHKIKEKFCLKGGQVCFRIGQLKFKIPLVHLRVFLVLTNLMVLAAAIASFLAGIDARSRVQNQFHHVNMFRENSRDQIEILNEWVSALVKNIENVLYITSSSLLLYWIIYGVAISLNFGESYEMCVLMVTVPHTVVMVFWELGLLAFFVKMARVDGHPMEGFYAAWSHTLVIIFTPTCLIQIITAALPFFISSSSQKEDDQLSVDQRGMWHTNMKMSTPLFMRPSTIRHASNSDYVDFNPQVSSFIHTDMVRLSEMPDQILMYGRPLPGKIARLRKTSLSAGQAVMNTMSKVYNANNSPNSSWRIGQENNRSQLQADDALPGVYQIYDDDDYLDIYDNDDYMEMSTESPPPSYHSQDEFLV